MESKYMPEEYIPTIDAILSVADSNQITVRKIRNALQELFTINLEPHKKHINEIILERYYRKDDEKLKEKQLEEKREEMMAQDAIMATRLSKTFGNSPVTRSAGRTAKTKKSVNSSRSTNQKTANKNNPFNKEMILSDDLASVIGVKKASRPQVVKLLWAYIKDNSLQNINDKRQILCDDKLEALFKKKTVGAFEMNKILSKHIFKEEDILGKDSKREKSTSSNSSSIKSEDMVSESEESNSDSVHQENEEAKLDNFDPSDSESIESEA